MLFFKYSNSVQLEISSVFLLSYSNPFFANSFITSSLALLLTWKCPAWPIFAQVITIPSFEHFIRLLIYLHIP